MFYKRINTKYMNQANICNSIRSNASIQRALVLMGIIIALIQPVHSQDAEPTEGVVIDQVIAVIGSNIVLQSDLQTQFEQYRAEAGIQGSESSMRCYILESMIFQKLLMKIAVCNRGTVRRKKQVGIIKIGCRGIQQL